MKQNQRGRFIKIAEVVSHDRKSRLLLSMSTAHEFKNHLTQFNDLYVTLGPQNPESAPNDGKFKTVVMTKDNRRYYLDLKENDRGRFLRVSIVRGANIFGCLSFAFRLPFGVPSDCHLPELVTNHLSLPSLSPPTKRYLKQLILPVVLVIKLEFRLRV